MSFFFLISDEIPSDAAGTRCQILGEIGRQNFKLQHPEGFFQLTAEITVRLNDN